MSSGPQLVVAGNLLLDDVVYADGTTRMGQPGGAALYAALGAALWGVRVGIVSRLGSDYPGDVIETLADRGIAVAGNGGPPGPTLRTWLLYENRRRRVVHRLDGPTHDDVSPHSGEAPADWRPAVVHLAPMPWTVQKEWIEAMAARPSLHLSADPYELLTDDRLDEWRQVFGSVDTLFLSEDEMQIPAALERPVPTLDRLGAGAPRLDAILYKQGASGGIAWRAGSPVLNWSPHAESLVDPTGAGDAFAGGVLAGRLLGEPLRRRLARGVVAAGYALSAAGADGLLAASPEEASARLDACQPVA